MKTSNEIFTILKNAFLDEDFSIKINFLGFDNSEKISFKQNNYNVDFGVSYNGYAEGLNNEDREYPEDKKVSIYNIKIDDLEVSFNGKLVDFTEDNHEELTEIILDVLENEKNKN